MANTSVINGLTPRRMFNGSPWNGKVSKYYIPSSDGTATFIGDLVKLAGSSEAATGRPTIAQAAAGSSTAVHVGVVVGFDPVSGVTVGSENLIRKHRPASTAMYAYVCDDPNVVYEIQEDAVGATTALVDVGENVDIIVAAGNTATGFSGMMADSSTHATTGTLPLKIIGFVQKDDNTPASANAKLEVIINSHFVHSGLSTAV